MLVHFLLIVFLEGLLIFKWYDRHLPYFKDVIALNGACFFGSLYEKHEVFVEDGSESQEATVLCFSDKVSRDALAFI